MKPFRNLVLTFAVAAASLFSADAELVKLIPADATFLAGMNADQIRNSRFGQMLLEKLKTEEENLNKFISATGFDPRRDLQEIIIASTEAPRKNGKGLVLARGRFDASRIKSFAALEGGMVSTYNGVEVLTAKGSKDGMLAFLDPTLAIAGNSDTVKAVLDNRVQPSALSAQTLQRINQLSTSYDAWLIAPSLEGFAGEIRNPQLGGAMQGNLAQSMESIAGGVRFGTNVELMAEATMRSEKDATAMVDVVRFLAGMLQMNSQDPKAAEAAKLLEKMQLSASGTQFRMSLELPDGFLESMFKQSSRKRSPVI